MASDMELDRNTILEKFASIKRMHDEVGQKQTEDYQKRLQKLKEEESNYMAKLLSQQVSNRPAEDLSARTQTSARRDLFLTSKTDQHHSNIPSSQQQHHSSYKSNARTSHHHHDPYDNNDHEWNIDDDFQPLNITDNDTVDERLSNRLTNDDEPDESYLTAYRQLLQTHHEQQQHQQQQQMMAQQEQENMLSTIFEASCEEATPMTSMIDVHQPRTQISSPPRFEHRDDYVNDSNDDDNHIEEENDDEIEEIVHHRNGPSFTAIDDIPVSTMFSKNDGLKYSEYVLQKLQSEKDEAFANGNQGAREKRPFLRKRQGLAHYQAPPKRRQPGAKTNENNNGKNENAKRPTSASSTGSNTRSVQMNQRARSNSSSASVTSGRQTPTNRPLLKNKPTKTTNNNNNIQPIKPTVPSSTHSNLLGKVDLDDEDDLLSKYQSKKPAIEHHENDHRDELRSSLNKFNSNLQTMIDSKWNKHKTAFQHQQPDEEEEVKEDDEEEADEEVFYPNSHQRTSSRNNGIHLKGSSMQPRKDLDEFEKLEQYAEEHPSMISTASYVEKVVLKEHPQSKTTDIFVNRMAHYHEEEADLKLEESTDLLSNPNRVRQRKVIPFRSKTDTRLEQFTAAAAIASDNDDNDDENDDDEDEEDPQWDDVAVAKVIPVTADEYNSDSGISSFKTDFPRAQQQQQQQKKDVMRSSDFGDDHSWAAPALNSLMLNTFPGLRRTAPPPASAAPPPPPPPPPSSAPVVEPNQDYSRLVREKAKELEKQIELFEKENGKLQTLCNERNAAIKKLKQDRDEFEKTKQREMEEFTRLKDEEMKKLKQEKRLFEQHRQQLRDHPDKREREEIELLKKQVATLQEDLKQRETRWSTNINRLKERIETLEYENAELKQEKDIIERKRLELMHQVQTNSKYQPQEEAVPARKSLVELQQTKARPKSAAAPTASKTQSLPKTTVVRNSEPAPAKPKATANGRRTPTSSIGVNGIKNNVDTSRKLLSLPATKRGMMTTTMDEPIPIPTVIEQPMIISERADSGNGGSDDDIHRIDARHDDRLSPLMNSEYPKSFNDDDESNAHSMTLDYKSLLTMATRTSSSATTLLKRHQETLSHLDQPVLKRAPLTNANHDSINNPTPRVIVPTTKSITFKENLTTVPTDSIIEEVRHNDGRIERIRSDQSKQIVFPNGSKQDISADGKHIRVQFYNGDYKEKHSDGRCVYKYASTNTTETEYPDGTRVCEFPNGQIEKHFPDGRQEHILPDKTKNIYLTDGTIISIKTNGEKFIQHANETKEVHTDTYKRKLFPNGSILTVFNTGEQEVRYANGKMKLKDAQGNIIMEKRTTINNHK